MPRMAREKSQSGIYHIMIRGANRQEMFHDDEDRKRFLETLKRYIVKVEMNVYGWCLMDNHVHLLLQEGIEEISITMKRIGVSYVWYYNQKYKTTGHLFQDRFKSEKVENDEYLLTVIRYIHQNPIKSGIVKNAEEWKWSSCLGYYGRTLYPEGLLNIAFVLHILSEDRDAAIKRFKEFNEQKNDDNCLDDTVNEKIRLSDKEAREEIIKSIGKIQLAQLKSYPKLERDELIKKVKRIEGISQRQAARILGVSPNLIFKA
ncbi:REP element-mobilizing transposase RayT [Anaerovirgula multivorans]|uniref:REP element-mobilizing transposase RayT n=1 Tax=Anaerovirgula multivorans TaxID=312168 RepID=A0A239DI60_9FIRM|nr:transposase [Anaerovirgula multivorans]SNS31423.1 REP element-mobilizing transposase RayT [Anaerovirgula multivorans]